MLMNPPPKRKHASVDASALENLWLRLSVGNRIRPRDAFLLRRLAVPPFDLGVVFEQDVNGYITGVGTPEALCKIDAGRLLSEFENRVGIPTTFAIGASSETEP